MDELKPTTPCAGLLPLTIGALTVTEVDLGAITSIAPFGDAADKRFVKALGMGFPAPNQTITAGKARCIWAGQGEALLTGAAPNPALADFAAVVDQSDAWATVTLSGEGGAEALARLVPVDMRLSAFGVDATVRTQLGHMSASITRVAEDTYLIAVFRSMAATLVHDLRLALEAVAARG
ncbi:sarcosine oxidase subunit gamma [Sulfitobacter donghicola]|uniref:Sarcosine oxidase subunit gamma n=1 Tax=Sulfitobacter donghicola DSW-25 = KCTC 12864 = JCM 14565 TaxID=1300350 RepID=A0A073II81_9RHOB|nr:sarcosine oxidase subunit gamma [Sulfitobacter donghicola]KEJ89280.1 sarcosine oxidase subunit gamma [Sulfitobacter donghicola DSW-25 = KCTC 12864 = JCM 14565]